LLRWQPRGTSQSVPPRVCARGAGSQLTPRIHAGAPCGWKWDCVWQFR